MLIQRGSKGDKVKHLQLNLKRFGFYNHPKVTGFFGPETEKAVKEYQKTRGIKPDGVHGPRTQDMLDNEDHARKIVNSPHIQGTHHHELLKEMYSNGDHALNLGKGGTFVHPHEVKGHYNKLHGNI